MEKFKKRMVSLIIICTIVLSLIPVSADNIRNLTDSTTIPGWACEISKVDGGIALDPQESHGGNYSMKLWNNTVEKNGFVRCSYTFNNLKDGHTYRYGFSSKVKNANGTIYTQMNWDRSTMPSLKPFGANADWRDFEFAYNHTSGTAYLRIVLEGDTEGLWLDDFWFYDTAEPMTAENNLISNPSFEKAEKNSNEEVSFESKKIIPVGFNDKIKTDGNVNDWKNISVYKMEMYNNLIEGVPTTVNAQIRYAYDDANFYFLIEAEDDVHFPIATTNGYWNGDGLQFTICKPDETYGIAYGAVYDNNADTTVKFGDTTYNIVTKRNGNKTVYEASIPWGAHFSEIPSVALFSAIVNDNDNDGFARKGCAEVSRGISDRKNSEDFPRLILFKDKEEFGGFFSGSAKVTIGEEAIYAVSVFNNSKKDKKISVKSEGAKLDTTFTAKAKSQEIYTFKVKHEAYGNAAVDVFVTDGITSFSDEVITDVCVNGEKAKEIIAKLKSYASELEKLVNLCTEKSIPIEYQKIKYNTVKLFSGYLQEDYNNNDFDRMARDDKVLTGLYNEAKTEMEELLEGKREPVSVPKYVTSPVKINGMHLEATTQREDGTTEERPVFFVGGGHWINIADENEVKRIADMGFNLTNPELGMWNVMNEARTIKHWAFRENGTSEYDVVDTSETKEVRHGEKSLKLTSDIYTTTNNYIYYRQTIPVKPGTTYEYGISSKAKNVETEAFYTVSSLGDKANRRDFAGTYDWRDEVYEFKTGENQTELSFVMLFSGKMDYIYLDNAFVREAGTEENLLKNGSFEEIYDENQLYSFEENLISNYAKGFEYTDKYNLSSFYAFASSYIPNYMYEQYPDIKLSTPATKFIPFNPLSDMTWNMFETFLKGVVPRFAQYESFDGLVTVNEPQYNAFISYPEFIGPFRNAMKEKYGEISALNARWGTNYASFDEVEMPKETEATARFYDWRVFNDEILPKTAWKIADVVKEIKPEVMSMEKVMDTFGGPEPSKTDFRVNSSNNHEITSKYMDLNGCDAWSLINNGYDVRWKNVYYDFMTSVKEVPVYNMEDHIIVDNPVLMFYDKEYLWNIVDIWTGAIHGRGGSALWILDRQDRTKKGSIYFNSVLSYRPDTIHSLGKTTYDLNRLSKEIVALQNAPANAAILYSQNSVPYCEEIKSIIFTASEGLAQNAQRTKFVVESQTEKFKDYKFIIVPSSISVTKTTLDALKSFAEGGGKLIIVGEDALTVNEYGDLHDEETVKFIKDNSIVMPYEDAGTSISLNNKKELRDIIGKVVRENNLAEVVIKNKATGENLENCEILPVLYEGSYIISLTSFDWEDKEVEIFINGKKSEACEDLINFEKFDDTVKLKGYVPLLLKVKN